MPELEGKVEFEIVGKGDFSLSVSSEFYDGILLISY
jgi:hypothetical protein